MVACLILLEKKYSCRLGQVFVEKRTLYAAVSACESHICSSGYIEVKEERFCEKKRIPSCIPDESPRTRRVIGKKTRRTGVRGGVSGRLLREGWAEEGGEEDGKKGMNPIGNGKKKIKKS